MKNHRIRDIDTGECLYYSSKGFAIRDAVQEIEKGKRLTVEDLQADGSWMSNLSRCFTLEHIILSSQREQSPPQETAESDTRMDSEIAQFRHTQELLEQSAHHGVYGYTITSRHDFITARLEQGAKHIERLFQAGKIELAVSLMNTPLWGMTCDDTEKWLQS